jgi:hypothetical protein
MKAAVSLDRFNRLAISRDLRAKAGFQPHQPLRAVAMPGKILIEALPSAGRLIRRRGHLVWTGELPPGVNSANAVNVLRDEI